jgi:hypothetical protein
MTDKKPGVTFTVTDDLEPPPLDRYATQSMSSMMQKNKVMDRQGRVLLKTTESANLETRLGNGFVGTAFEAYNNHCHLVLTPDAVWIAVTTALASFIDRHAEQMRHLFVAHDGKKELVVEGGGTIKSADYDGLVGRLAALIDQETKGDIKEWLECAFTTTTPLSSTVSRIVVMGAMKNYFTYKVMLCCGLPSVTLEGTIDDWREIRARVDRLGQMERQANMTTRELAEWSVVLGGVLDHFVDAFNGNVDKQWWNSITHYQGGGSGPSYLSGWIMAFCPWDDRGRFVLKNPRDNEKGSYGRIETGDIPACTVEVPVTINDNGREYKTLFYAGNIHTRVELPPDVGYPKLTSVQDWALVDVTQASSQSRGYEDI